MHILNSFLKLEFPPSMLPYIQLYNWMKKKKKIWHYPLQDTAIRFQIRCCPRLSTSFNFKKKTKTKETQFQKTHKIFWKTEQTYVIKQFLSNIGGLKFMQVRRIVLYVRGKEAYAIINRSNAAKQRLAFGSAPHPPPPWPENRTVGVRRSVKNEVFWSSNHRSIQSALSIGYCCRSWWQITDS